MLQYAPGRGGGGGGGGGGDKLGGPRRLTAFFLLRRLINYLTSSPRLVRSPACFGNDRVVGRLTANNPQRKRSVTIVQTADAQMDKRLSRFPMRLGTQQHLTRRYRHPS